jgi:predicted nucleic acid-binding protein
VIYSHIYLSLRKKGKPIGSNDMWIAALALELDNELLTLDDDFKNISGLMLGSI